MSVQKIDAGVLSNIQRKLVDRSMEHKSLFSAGFTKTASEVRQYIYGMMFVLNELCYEVVYTDSGEPVIISRDE